MWLKNKKLLKKGGDYNSGIYNFKDDTKIIFFADLEGNMPIEILKLINNFEKNTVIVFTGDLKKMISKLLKNLLKKV